MCIFRTLLLCVTVLWMMPHHSTAAVQPTEPSFVLFPLDDLSVPLLMQCIDEGRCPNIAQAMKEGAYFSNMHTSFSWCCPAWATILTGMNPSNHGILANEKKYGGGYVVFLEKGHAKHTIAVYLSKAGLTQIAHFGKLLNERLPGMPPLPGYTVSETVEGVSPYWMSSANFAVTHTNGTISTYRNNTPNMTDLLVGSAIRYIRGADPKKRLYVEVAPFAPHAPAEPPKRFENACSGVLLSRGRSFNALPSGATSDLTTLPPLRPWEISNLEDFHRRSTCSLMAIDENFGMLLEALRKRGGKWMIALTSDNGKSMGEHQLDGKTTYFTEDTNLPLLLLGSDIQPGVYTHLVTLADIFPTVLAHFGVAIPAQADGRPLQEILHNPNVKWRQAMELIRGSSMEQQERRKLSPAAYAGIANFLGIRTASGIVYVEFQNGEKALYLGPEIDRYQEHNVVADHPELAQALSRWMTMLHRCQGEGCRVPEDTLPTGMMAVADVPR